MKLRIIITIALLAIVGIGLKSQNYVVVNSATKIYEEPNARGYVARNTNDEEINVIPGMVFKRLDVLKGWDKVEYSPGLSGLIMETMLADNANLEIPDAGYYNPVNNSSETVNIACASGEWTLSVNGHNYKGTQYGPIVVFNTTSGEQMYTLVKINGKSVVCTYSNDITGFF